MIKLGKAVLLALEQVPHTTGSEKVLLQDSIGRILAQDIINDVDYPPFDRAIMDGFACHLEDVDERLEIVDVIAAGSVPHAVIGHGQCAKIMTGAMIPVGCSKVVKIEDCEVRDDKYIDVKVHISDNYIAKRGSVLKKGTRLFQAGKCISFNDLPLLALAGASQLNVRRKIKLGVLTTGSELVEPNETPHGAQIRNINSTLLIGFWAQLHVEVVNGGVVPDDADIIGKHFRDLLSTCDVVLISGGSSVGDFDLAQEVLDKNGFSIIFDRVAIRPGKPTLLARRDEKFVFAVPGNPLSAFVACSYLIKPFLYKMMGHTFTPLILQGELIEAIRVSCEERLTIFPVKFTSGKVMPLPHHGSADIFCLSDANGFVEIAPHTSEIRSGTLVEVRLL